MFIPHYDCFARRVSIAILTATIAVSTMTISAAQDNATIPEVQAMIDEWNEKIRIDKMLKQRSPAMTDKHSLAWITLIVARSTGATPSGMTLPSRTSQHQFVCSKELWKAKIG